MIYTVSLSPAVDYTPYVDGFAVGQINRARKVSFGAGGKAVNVSAVLSNFGIPSVCVCFLAGFTGQYIRDQLKQRGIMIDAVEVRGMNRLNIQLKSGCVETEISGTGPELSEEDFAALTQKLCKVQSGSTVVLSGSLPASLRTDAYAVLLSALRDKKVNTVVDTAKNNLLPTLPFAPYLLKPNRSELGEIFGTVIQSKEDAVGFAKKLQELGARNVLVSLDRDGAVLVTENNEIFVTDAPHGAVIDTVGAGDSMVAGWLIAKSRDLTDREAFLYATACGSATAFSDVLCTPAEASVLYEALLIR